MTTRAWITGLLLIAASLLAGCANVPLASHDADALAKQMKPVPDKAVIYIFRNEEYSAPWRVHVALDGNDIGATGALTYMRLVVEPGEHVITSLTRHSTGLVVNVEAGRVYYVWQEIQMGFFQPRAVLQKVDRMTAEIALRTCQLIEG